MSALSSLLSPLFTLFCPLRRQVSPQEVISKTAIALSRKGSDQAQEDKVMVDPDPERADQLNVRDCACMIGAVWWCDMHGKG